MISVVVWLVASEETQRGRRKALVIAVSDYKNNLPKLDFCKRDGERMLSILQTLDYEIYRDDGLIGEVNRDQMRDAIMGFFGDPTVYPDDTLLFYFSGHGVPEGSGENYLATSDINPEIPYLHGFSFEDLTKMMNRSVSTRIVTILDCCYSGSAKISKGSQRDATTKGVQAISNTINPGDGRCLLAACQGYEEAYGARDASNSIFTSFLIEGLSGKKDSVDADGNVTPDTLGKYVHNAMMSLRPEERPRQKPIRKVEASGDIILAEHPELARHGTDQLLGLLLEGKVSEFNELRAKNPYMAVNFSMANLHAENLAGANLERANFYMADLSKANLEKANLSKANLMRANLVGATLRGTNLAGADLQEGHLEKANLSNANLMRANLSKANLVAANFSNADLQQATLLGAEIDESTNFEGAELRDSIFQDRSLLHRTRVGGKGKAKGKPRDVTSSKEGLLGAVDLRGRDLRGADFHGRNLAGAILQDANLASADLGECDLSGATLTTAILSKANLSKANLYSAELSGANLSSSNLEDADLRKANLSGADLSNANLRNTDLREANLSGINVGTSELMQARISMHQLIEVLRELGRRSK